MSAWNVVLKSLHSALIDELNEKYPNEKPELGLPIRTSGWLLSPSSEKSIISEITIEHSHGLVTLGFLNTQKDTDMLAILKKIMDGSKKEFQRHGIQPVFTKPILTPKTTLCQMMIWLPISISFGKNKGTFDLGVGIK